MFRIADIEPQVDLMTDKDVILVFLKTALIDRAHLLEGDDLSTVRYVQAGILYLDDWRLHV